jgi:hypothetical protein
VARGYITRTEADAALLASTLAAKRQGRLPHEVRDVFGGLRHILDLHLEKERVRRMMTAHRITRRISPLVTLRKPSNAVLAEAHDVNGADGFPLAEPEVSDMADLEMYWAMPAARPRHAR